MSKKTKKGPHPHDKKEQQQIAGCPRCSGKEIVTPPAQEAEPAPLLPDTSGLAPLEVLPLSSVPLEAEPDKAPDAPPTAPVGFSPH
jgi:hypothetical protein